MNSNKHSNIMKKMKVYATKGKVQSILASIICVFVNRYFAFINLFYTSYKRLLFACLSIVLFYFSCSFSMPMNIKNEENNAFYLSVVSDHTYNEEELADIAEVDGSVDKFVEEFEVIFEEEIAEEELSVTQEGKVIYSTDDILDAEITDLAVECLDENSDDNISIDSLDKDDWKIILINKQNPIPQDYNFKLANINGSMRCDERVLPHLQKMFRAALDDGINLIVCSPYRDYQRQTYLFDRKIKSFMGKGFSYLEAYKLSSNAVALPGASEHQTGLAIDIISSTFTSLSIEFEDDPAGKWLRDNAHKFGFNLRYPRGKEYITGTQYEPWHFRYVGVNAATIMKEQGLTLEELVKELE